MFKTCHLICFYSIKFGRARRHIAFYHEITYNLVMRENIKLAFRFYLVNCLFACGIGIIYLSAMQLPSYADLSWSGLALVWLTGITLNIGYLPLLAFPIAFLIPVILLFVARNRKIAFCISGLIAAFVLFLLLADALLFYQYRFHLNRFFLSIFFSTKMNQFFDFSALELGIIVLGSVVLLLLEWLTVVLVLRSIKRRRFLIRPQFFGLIVFAGLLISTFNLLYAPNVFLRTRQDIFRAHAIVTKADLFPFYDALLKAALPKTLNPERVMNIFSGAINQPSGESINISYPLHPLLCRAPKRPYNLIVILVDSLRADMLNKQDMPYMYRFSQRNLVFKHHLSGGNSTLAGMLSFFYAISPSYRESLLKEKISPVLMNVLSRDHYQLAVFPSAFLGYPFNFDKTIFKRVKNLQLRQPANSPDNRDRELNQQFIHFLKQAKNRKQPFFAFAFYDAAHSYCQTSSVPRRFQPAASMCERIFRTNKTNPLPFLNQYKNAVRFDDQLIHRVLSALQKEGLLEDSVVIISGDHGQEFNDSKTNSWDHGENFTAYETEIPLVIHWPGKSSAVYRYETTHYDIAPTLMHRLLGCQNPYSDYSIGRGLFRKGGRPFVLINSYLDYAVVQPHQATIVGPTGQLRVVSPENKLLFNTTPNFPLLKKSWKLMYRFSH